MDIEQKLQNRLNGFDKACKQLEKALAMPSDEFIRDSAIQRFEFTFELFWKILKTYCNILGYKTDSPRGSIKQIFKAGTIEDDPIYLAMLQVRNLTTHNTYEEKLAEEIYGKLPAYSKAMQTAIINIRKDFTS
ncbi:MAG: nucleotidyltransferase substrate binding protein [Deltaproteobacteria bacterium]|nr:nucleotidyltransferase substrate binding protein [Deltaproteobacteria bacterium]